MSGFLQLEGKRVLITSGTRGAGRGREPHRLPRLDRAASVTGAD